MESNRGSWWLDLLAVGVAAVVPVAVVLFGPGYSTLRLVAGVPLVLFLPGYALLSALFPESSKIGTPPFTRETGEGIDKSMRSRSREMTGIDRLGVSVALSAVLVPSVALTQFLVSGAILATQLALGLGILTWAFVCMALARRLRLPPKNRFSVAPWAVSTFFSRYFRSDCQHLSNPAPYEATNTREVLLNVLLVGALLVAVTSAAYAFVQPPESQDYEELAVLTEDASGDYVADDYPDDLSDADPLYLSVTNNRDTTQRYVLMGSLEVVDEDGLVIEQDNQFRQYFELEPGERRMYRHEPADTLDGDRLRIEYELFRPGAETEGPHRSARIWITHTESETETTPQPTPTATSTATPEQTPTSTPTPTPTPAETPTPTETDDGITDI